MFNIFKKVKLKKDEDAILDLKCIEFDYLSSQINLVDISSGTTAFVKCPVCFENIMVGLIDISNNTLIIENHQIKLLSGVVKPQRV